MGTSVVGMRIRWVSRLRYAIVVGAAVFALSACGGGGDGSGSSGSPVTSSEGFVMPDSSSGGSVPGGFVMPGSSSGGSMFGGFVMPGSSSGGSNTLSGLSGGLPEDPPGDPPGGSPSGGGSSGSKPPLDPAPEPPTGLLLTAGMSAIAFLYRFARVRNGSR